MTHSQVDSGRNHSATGLYTVPAGSGLPDAYRVELAARTLIVLARTRSSEPLDDALAARIRESTPDAGEASVYRLLSLPKVKAMSKVRIPYDVHDVARRSYVRS